VEKEITTSSRKLGLNWKQRNSKVKIRFFILQLLLSVFSSISGFFTHSYINKYPASAIVWDFSKNVGIGELLFGGINGININGTILTSIGKSKTQKIKRILSMVISVLVGLFGYIGITKVLSLECITWSGPFTQCTKYGVHNNKEVNFC